jgi:hypothetical protein
MREDSNQCTSNEIHNMITKHQRNNGRELLMRKKRYARTESYEIIAMGYLQ